MKTYDVKGLMSLLMVSERVARQLMKSQEVKSKKVGSRWLTTEEAVKEYMSK